MRVAAFLTVAPLAVSEFLTVEILRLLGTTIAAAASVYAAWAASRPHNIRRRPRRRKRDL